MIKKLIILLVLAISFIPNCFAALDWDGVDDTVSIGAVTGAPTGASERTIAFWFKTDSFDTGVGDMMYSYVAGGGNYQEFFIVAEDNAVAIAWNGYREITATTALSTGVWYHFAMVVPSGATNCSDALAYINGISQTLNVEAGSDGAMDTAGAGAVDISLGSDSPPANYYNGEMTEVLLSATGLSATQIAQLSGNRPTISNSAPYKRLPLNVDSANIKGYWPLDDETAGTSADGDNFTNVANPGDGDGTADNGGNNTGMGATAETILSYPPQIQ